MASAEVTQAEINAIYDNRSKFGHMVLNRKDIGVPEGAIYIGRGSKWGNQWSHLPNSSARHKVWTREEAVVCHRRDLLHRVKTGVISISELAQLADKVLVCYCSPELCHGHTLAAAAKWAKEQLSKGS